ncbi:MAG: PAS domain S-box protein [Pseudomonadota bacterium]
MPTQKPPNQTAQSSFSSTPQLQVLASRVPRLGTWTLDLKEDRVIWSPELEDIFGIERDSFVGTQAAFHSYVHPLDLARLQKAIGESLEKGEEYCTIFRYKHGSGEWRWMEGRGLPTFDAHGNPIRIDGVGIDVTDRTMAENVRFRLAAIVESSEDAIISKTLDGVVTSWNAGAERLFGFTAEEMIGASITRLIPTELLPEEAEILAKLRKGERIEHYETRRLVKSGGLVDVSLTVSPVRDVTGAIVGASKIARDVTQLRAAVAEREQLLESERAARSEAERLGHLKDEFLATLSHELRTPLTAILGWCSVLRRRKNLSQEDLINAIDTIHRNAKSQAKIIEDLLEMSRIVSGKIHLETDELDFGDLVQLAVDGIRPAAGAKGIAIRLLREPAAGVINGDAARLQQILWNLLSNAVKFTPTGGSIRVTLQRAGDQLELIIQDSGIGIPRDFLPFIFERFRQADGSTTREHGGLGLGLSIVRNLVELHGGSIIAGSPGENLGATFTVRLPAVLPNALTATGVFTGTFGQISSPLASLAGTVILVVDDEPDGRSLLARLLTDTGAEVLTAASAEEGLDTLTTRPVNVLISDVGMPGLDGYEFIRRVRASDNGSSRIPAIALTAYARTEDRERSLAAGFQRHISKPYSIADLTAAVASLIPATP